MAGVEGVGGDVGDGLPAARHREADGMVLVQAGEQVDEDLPLRVVLDHLDLLADDALLLLHALGGEPGDRDKGEEGLQILLKLLGALKIVPGDGRAGEGVGRGAVGRQILKGIALLGVEHLVLQKMGHTGGGLLPGPVQLKAHIHPAVVGGEEGEGLAEAGLYIHINGQAILEPGVEEGLSHPGIDRFFHVHHASLPFRK